MTSKYDPFWTAHLEQIRDGIRLASTGGRAVIPLSGLRDEGERQSWHGTADVRGNQIVGSAMAHATALARIAASNGICEQWPGRTIRFAISATGDKLTIRAAEPSATPSLEPMPVPADKPAHAWNETHHDSELADRQTHTDEFYALLDELARKVSGPRLLRDCTGDSGWPSHGVYFFYESGEHRPDGTDRVVRVGTHALTETSQTTLWNRLRQHRGHVGGRHAGGGDHRASVFRRHVGAAIIRRDGLSRELLDSWLDRHNPSMQVAAQEEPIEVQVSQYIGDMPFLWLSVPERSDRDSIERNSIGLLSRRVGGLDIPSPGWLGHYAEREQIRDSGLWNVNHVDLRYHPGFLRTLARLVRHS